MNIFMLPNLTEVLEDMLRPNVMKGAAWLDEHESNWVSKIVPETLDLTSTEVCICGQVFGNYRSRPDALEDAARFGFSTPDFDEIVRDITDGGQWDFWGWANRNNRLWGTLDRLWLNEIYWRLSPGGIDL